MGKESLWRSRAMGWLLTALGGFPVQRGTADRDALRAAMAVIERGEPLVMFPEGTRQTGPKIAEMFDGPAYVACRTGAPIIPVGMGGTEAAMPVGSKGIRPVKMAIVIGDHITPVAAAGVMNRNVFVSGIIHDGAQVNDTCFLSRAETDQLGGVVGHSIAVAVGGDHHAGHDIALVG